MNESATTTFLRHATLVLAAFGTLVTPIDLLLVSHTQKPTQWIPFGLLAVNAVLIVWVGFRPNARGLNVFRWFSIPMLLGGLVGAALHFNGNLEIAHEVDPTVTGLALLLEGLRGGNPVLAPGLFAQIALLGLLFTYKHPALEARVISVVTMRDSVG